MYQSPDFIKVELMVKTAFAYASGCPFDEGTDYVHVTYNDICPNVPRVTYVELVKTHPYLCYSSHNM